MSFNNRLLVSGFLFICLVVFTAPDFDGLFR